MTATRWILATLLLAHDALTPVVGSHLRSESSNFAANLVQTASTTSSRKDNRIAVAPQRKLADGEITDPLRQFIGDAVMKLPPLEASQETWLGTMNLNVTEFLCFDIAYSDININILEEGDVADSFHLEVTDMLFKCTMNIYWSYGEFEGVGTAIVNSDKNYLSAKMSTDLSSENRVGSCEGTEVAISEIEFDGDMSLRVMNLYRGFIRHAAEDKVEEIFCMLMSEDMLGLAMNLIDEKLNKYSEDLPSWRSDPLWLESNVTIPGDKTFINLQNDDEAGDLINMALKNLNDIYAAKIYDEMAPTEDKMDYGINIIMRQKLLNENRVLEFLDDDEVESHVVSHDLVDINVTLLDLELMGLDAATVLTPVTVIGSSTVQSKLFWSSISVLADLSIEVHASTGPDSIFSNGDTLAPIKERVTVMIGADNIDATVSLMVPLDRSEVEALPMGYVLNWESLPPCIVPVLFNLQVSGLNLTIGSIHDPVIQGIESNDINKIATKSVQIGLASFEDAILKALPNLFQTTVRDLLKEVVTEYHCPVNETGAETGGRRILQDFEEAEAGDVYFNVICAILCVCTAALAAGLTMGLLSLDELMLLIKERAGATEKERKAAASLLPIVRQHHLLLVTLLLMNAMANEALPLFLDKLVPGYVAVILSVTLVLFFGEIIPSAVFTGPDQIKLASRLAPLVKAVMVILSPIAYPIAKVLDHLLHEEKDGMYNRGELSALVRIQYEEHLATKRRRKTEINHDLKEFESMESLDSYTVRRSSSLSVRPEIKSTIRAISRQFSHRNIPRNEDLHVDEVTMVEGALQMGTTLATDVYTAWKDVFCVPNDMILNERNIVKVYRSGYSRIPVYEQNKDDPHDNTRIVGILSSRQLIVIDSQDERQISTLPLAIPHCVAPNTTLVDLINLFQTGGVKGSHMALVCSRPDVANIALKKGHAIPGDAGLMGVVSLEDVLENLIQEQIYDEYDRKERKHLYLARWGLQRWKMFVRKRKKQRGDPDYQSFTQSETGEPKLLSVVNEAMEAAEQRAHGRIDSPTSEKTSLLSKLNPFR